VAYQEWLNEEMSARAEDAPVTAHFLKRIEEF
jgi:hypothetical protein